MGLCDIRRNYGVPAKRGGRVRYTGGREPAFGSIRSARGAHLYIHLDGAKRPQTFHPTWELEYLDGAGGGIDGND